MIVYRIENSLGEGPYFNEQARNPEWKKLWMESAHVDKNRHPEPFDDQRLKAIIYSDTFEFSNYVCGFYSMDQLHKWFNKSEIDKLKTLGFDVKVIDVPAKNVLVGDTQVLILRN